VPKRQPQNIGGRLAAKGWRTGSVLSPSLAASLSLQRASEAPRALKEGERLVVVSQTCDIVAAPEAEPYVEVLLVRQKASIDHTKANLRSTRHLSFRAQAGGLVVEAHATDRYWIPKELFEGHSPDTTNSLDDGAATKVCEWLGLRYTRPAWPNALVKRLPPRDQVEKILRAVALSVAEIRVAISDCHKELPDGEVYKLAIYAVMDSTEYNTNQGAREACVRAFTEFLTLLRKCRDIEVLDGSDLLPGDQFSWQMEQMTERWNFANLSAQGE
jgi:hypothetical protein